MAAPAWEIRAEHDTEFDVLDVSFVEVVLHDDGDVDRWEHELVRALSWYRRGIDVLLNLDGIDLTPQSAAPFGRVLGRVLAAWTGASVHYGGVGWTLFAINTSTVRNGTSSRSFADRKAALAGLRALRRASQARGASASSPDAEPWRPTPPSSWPSAGAPSARSAAPTMAAAAAVAAASSSTPLARSALDAAPVLRADLSERRDTVKLPRTISNASTEEDAPLQTGSRFPNTKPE